MIWAYSGISSRSSVMSEVENPDGWPAARQQRLGLAEVLRALRDARVRRGVDGRERAVVAEVGVALEQRG